MPSTRRPPTHSRRVGNLLIRFLLATLLFTQLSSAQFFTANNDPDDEYFLVNGVFTFSVKNWYQAALNGEPYYGESFPWHDPARLASSSIHRKTTAPLAAAADEAAPVATTTITSTTTTTAPDVDLCIDLDDNVESKMDSTVDATMDISPNSNLGGHPATKALDKHGMDVTSFWGTALATMLFAAFLGALIMKRKRYVKRASRFVGSFGTKVGRTSWFISARSKDGTSKPVCKIVRAHNTKSPRTDIRKCIPASQSSPPPLATPPYQNSAAVEENKLDAQPVLDLTPIQPSEAATSAEHDTPRTLSTSSESSGSSVPSISPLSTHSSSTSSSSPSHHGRKTRHTRNLSVPPQLTAETTPSLIMNAPTAPPKMMSRNGFPPLSPSPPVSDSRKRGRGKFPGVSKTLSREALLTSSTATTTPPLTKRVRDAREVRHSASVSHLPTNSAFVSRADSDPLPVTAKTPASTLAVPATRATHSRSQSTPIAAGARSVSSKPNLMPPRPTASLPPTTAKPRAPEHQPPSPSHLTRPHQDSPDTQDPGKWRPEHKKQVLGAVLEVATHRINPTPSPPPSYEDVLEESRQLINVCNDSQPDDDNLRNDRNHQRQANHPQWYSPFLTGLDFDMTTAVDSSASTCGAVVRRPATGAVSALESRVVGAPAWQMFARQPQPELEVGTDSAVRDNRTVTPFLASPDAVATMPTTTIPPGFRPLNHPQHHHRPLARHPIAAHMKPASLEQQQEHQQRQSRDHREPIPGPQGFSLFDRRLSFIVGRSGGR